MTLYPELFRQLLLPIDSQPQTIPHWSHTATIDAPRRAAILIPLLAPTQVDGSVKMLLTRRAEHLKQHPGEISFPGGAAELSDADLLHTAIRETHEETGIDKLFVEPLGVLGDLDTISGYRLRAYVGWVKPGHRLVADASEVAELVSANLVEAINPNNYKWQQRMTSAGQFNLPEINLNGHRVWGVTGVILWRLTERLSSLVSRP